MSHTELDDCIDERNAIEAERDDLVSKLSEVTAERDRMAEHIKRLDDMFEQHEQMRADMALLETENDTYKMYGSCQDCGFPLDKTDDDDIVCHKCGDEIGDRIIAQLEAERDDFKVRMQSWHDSAMTLADQRDDLARQLAEALGAIAAAVAEEREACAKVADEIEHSGMVLEVKMKHKIAAAIRARK